MSEEVLQNFFGSIGGQVLVVAAIAILLVLVAKTDKKRMDTKMMVKTAVLIAVAYVLNQITLYRMPQGGSITPGSMFVVIFIGYMFGTRQGILAGMAFGLLDLLINPYVIHPVQMLLDYPLAFGALGLGSIFRNKNHGLLKTYIFGIFCRFIVSSLSGIIFFLDITNGVMAGLVAAISYNLFYVGTEGVVTAIILCIPQVSKFFERLRNENQA